MRTPALLKSGLIALAMTAAAASAARAELLDANYHTSGITESFEFDTATGHSGPSAQINFTITNATLGDNVLSLLAPGTLFGYAGTFFFIGVAGDAQSIFDGLPAPV
jgi:hypothetical protein